jgi:putative colanic acid biosynthesis glycosyltransferase
VIGTSISKSVQCGANNALLLSIITVCRNDAARLKLTADSISEFYGDARFEHVVVDGLSTDGTNSLAETLAQSTNFSFYSSRDSGIYDAMNRGVAYAKAPLLLFLNCGDTMLASPEELSACLGSLVAADGVASLDIACFPVRQIGAKGSRCIAPSQLACHKMPVSHQGMVFARRFVLQNTYQSSYKIAGDYDLYLRAGRVGIIAGVGCPPLVGIEVEGIASTNPMVSYLEYLSIAHKRLRGWPRLAALSRIAIRALCVVFVKAIVPRRWVAMLRGV